MLSPSLRNGFGFYAIRSGEMRVVGIPYWFLFVLVATPTYHWLWSRRRWAAPGLCRTCGYDLRATPDRCPECGTKRAAHAAKEEACLRTTRSS